MSIAIGLAAAASPLFEQPVALFLEVEELMRLTLNVLSRAVLYTLVAAGLAVIFGMTDIINFAHGVFYMLGAYLALSIIDISGSFFVALLVAPLLVGIFGAAVERATLNRIYGRGPLYHILITFGFVLIITDLVQWFWGPAFQNFTSPPVLSGSMGLGPIEYPKYRLFVIVVGALIALATWLIFRYSRFGLIIRAGALDRQTVRLMGVDISKYFTLVFGFGCLLAGAAGVLAAPYLSVHPEMGNQMLIIAFIVVIVGGLGSFAGAVVASVLIAFLESVSILYLPELTGYLVYLAMLGILLFRPEGILGAYEVRKELAKISFEETIEPVSLADRRVIGLLVLLAAVPITHFLGLLSSYYLGLIALMFIWGLFALSLDTVMGYLGLISFGHAAFWGVGAYSVALIVTEITNSFVLAVLVAVAASTALAWAVGAVSVRVHGVYFAMITLAVAQLLWHFANTTPEVTGGSSGLGIFGVDLLGVIDLSDRAVFYYVALGLLMASYYVTVRVMDSPFGRIMTAIRESERRVSFLGYEPNKYKRQAFALSGGLGGLAGALYMTYNQFVTPNELYWVVSGDVIFAMIFGGIGTLYGPIFGGSLLVGMEHILSSYFRQWRLIIGVILVLVVMFAPRGLVSVYLQSKRLLDDRLRSQDSTDHD